MGTFTDRTGEIFTNIQGCELEIIKYFGNKNCTIRYNDKHSTTVESVSYSRIVKGKVKNPNYPIICNTGFVGQGKYIPTKYKKATKCYFTWNNMIKRCYSEKEIEGFIPYKNCSVDERWHNFQNFAEWFEKNYKPEFMEGWHLDKDILFKGNKIYSPETCCFVPNQVNQLLKLKNSGNTEFLGVTEVGNKFRAVCKRSLESKHLGYFDTPEKAFKIYKVEKEKEIKRIANKYKHQITEACYKALINYRL
jgi:hypothetical protein